tara:strand:- start:108 stop:1265 length:1158 start_codon:yes stop_codon:yes gene_type:complete
MYTFNKTPIIGIEIEIVLSSTTRRQSGIEVITNALRSNNINWCKVITDATSSDQQVFEIVLPPMAICPFFNTKLLTIEGALLEINAGITTKCGGHVHFGIEWLDNTKMHPEDFCKEQINHIVQGTSGFYSANKADPMPFYLMKTVATRYGMNQLLINNILPNSRTNNTYCRPIDRQTSSSRWNQATTLRELNSIIGGKFNAINFEPSDPTSSRYKGTIEFRQNSGSIECKKILNWIELIYTLYKTTDNHFLQYQNDLAETTTPDQPYRQGTRLDQIYQLCRTDDGATVQDLMMATGTTRSNIAGRISEMRTRFGDGAIVTNTQQANGRSYGSGDEFASYKILKTFRSGSTDVTMLAGNRAGNPSIWSEVSDELFEYFNTRAQTFS